MTGAAPRAELQYLARWAAAVCGAEVDLAKAAAIETRLASVARRDGYASVDALLAAACPPRDEAMARNLVDALTPGDSWFFRDGPHFRRIFEEAARALFTLRGRPLRVWSAGCSTGQEVWSAVLAARALGVGVAVLGTDVSERRLEKAQAGLYTQFEVQRGLPIRTLVDAFDRVDDAWRVGAGLRAGVAFSWRNLLDAPAGFGPFDLILCRHTLSGFTPEARRQALVHLAGALEDDGVLALGAGEATHGGDDLFRAAPGRPGLYLKVTPRLRRVA